MKIIRLRNLFYLSGAMGAYIIYNYKLPEIEAKGEAYQLLTIPTSIL